MFQLPCSNSDPIIAKRSALSKAASIGSLILTTESLVAAKKEKKSASAGGGHSHGGDDYDY